MAAGLTRRSRSTTYLNVGDSHRVFTAAISPNTVDFLLIRWMLGVSSAPVNLDQRVPVGIFKLFHFQPTVLMRRHPVRRGLIRDLGPKGSIIRAS